MDSIKNYYWKILSSIELNSEDITFNFNDNTSKTLTMEASCCENLYMDTDDDLSTVAGQVLQEIDLDLHSSKDMKYDVEEIHFLVY